MTRIIGTISALFLAMVILVPVAAAANPFDPADGRMLMSVGGSMTIPAGDSLDSVVIVNGTANIAGHVRSLIVIDGTANLTGGSAVDIVAITGHVNLDETSEVTGRIRAVESTISAAPGASIQGGVVEGLDLYREVLVIGPALFLVYLGFVLAALAAALLLVAVAARQVRSAEDLIGRDPLPTFFAGLGALAAIIVAASLAIVTIVGAPLGVGLLIGFLPGILFVGYVVAGISLGDWMLRRLTQRAPRERPYAAAAVGIVVLGLLSVIPTVGGFASLFGVGAITRLMWRNARQSGASEPVGASTSTLPAAS